jgi:hypothetical protein
MALLAARTAPNRAGAAAQLLRGTTNGMAEAPLTSAVCCLESNAVQMLLAEGHAVSLAAVVAAAVKGILDTLRVLLRIGSHSPASQTGGVAEYTCR